MKSNAVLPVEKALQRGSFASHIYPDPKARRRNAQGIAVRVVQYTLAPDTTDTADAAERSYRLITTITDQVAAPADELAQLYTQRWEIEPPSTNSRPTNRTQEPPAWSRPGLAIQDARWGDPGSLWLSVRALRDPLAGAFGGNRLRARSGRAVLPPITPGSSQNHRKPRRLSPEAIGDAQASVSAEILHELLTLRRPCTNARVVKRKMSGYQLKHAHHRHAPTVNRYPAILK